MTVTYTREVATSKGISCFLKLLLRWKGSIYKLVYRELIIFLLLFYSLHFIYVFLLNDIMKNKFETIVHHCHNNTTLIPLSFVLGFYVSIVMTRWWNQYCHIPFPEPIAAYVTATIHGQDERGKMMRRTIMRYVCLSITMLFTFISSKVKKRFPDLGYLVKAGLLTENEKEILDDINRRKPQFSKHWVPLIWAASIVTRARKEERITDNTAVKSILDEFNKLRGKSRMLINYDYISIPLVYTQVVTLAVYTYFLASVMGQQPIIKSKGGYSPPFPIFTLLQFFFYMGWLKVAETLINPFGDDDDDFDLNWMVDRNIQISYLIVDEMHHEHPELIKDQYWDEVFPDQLPYTKETEAYSHIYPVASTANIFAQTEEDHPIMFSTKGARHGSQQSVYSNSKAPATGRVRKTSITNYVRKFLPRNDSHSSVPDVELLEKIPRKMIEDVIEEVDEQLTIMHKREEAKRANVMDIFRIENTKNELDNTKANGQVVLETDENEDDLDSHLMALDRGQQERLIRIKYSLTNYLNAKENDDNKTY